MSGIVGIVNWDGTHVDPRLLSRLTDARSRTRDPMVSTAGMAVPSVWGTHRSGPLATRRRRRSRSSLDGRTWITADARVDGRADLVRELTAHGCYGLRDATDTALILHAYRVWGESCVGNLLGDFAFAIWDGERRRLFCARDHFGVKPLFYAEGQASSSSAARWTASACTGCVEGARRSGDRRFPSRGELRGTRHHVLRGHSAAAGGA